MEDFWIQYGDDMLPVIGDFPRKGNYLPSFMLVDDQKHDAALESFSHTPKLIVTLLSVDEDEHAGLLLLRETRRFLDGWPHLKLIVITVDSPSSLARARHEHGLPNIALLSTLRGRDFHKRYGVLITEYPLSGYTSPSIILADAANVVHYSKRCCKKASSRRWPPSAKPRRRGSSRMRSGRKAPSGCWRRPSRSRTSWAGMSTPAADAMPAPDKQKPPVAGRFVLLMDSRQP